MNVIKILIVDDSKTYLEFAAKALEGAGYEVYTADNAWISNLVSTKRPDVILMDVQLGSVSGTEAVNILRKRSFCKNTCILLHSSGPASKLESLAKACGASGYIIKDGKEETIRNSIKNSLLSAESRNAMV